MSKKDKEINELQARVKELLVENAKLSSKWLDACELTGHLQRIVDKKEIREL